jgi:NitT/TauT family transport system substrate-binding protein
VREATKLHFFDLPGRIFAMPCPPARPSPDEAAPVPAGGRLLRLARGLAVAGALAGLVPAALAGEKFVYLTNWIAQAEHGGFYQAVATGLYRKAGLDVEIRMGGPQVNILQVMAAGQADCVMGSNDLQAVLARQNGVPIVTVAAMFQKDPEVLIAHDDVNSLEDMKTRTILISSASYQGTWPWLKARYGFQDSQARPYTFNIQPFVADRNLVQEGYVTSEPYALQKAGVKIHTFLLSDYGYPAYSTTVACMESTLARRHQAVAAFVRASAEGWKSYLADPAPGNALIKKDNPDMTDDQLAASVARIRSSGLVTSGDAARLGIGVLTETRLKASYDFLVAAHLVDPARTQLARTYTTEFVRDLKILP